MASPPPRSRSAGGTHDQRRTITDGLHMGLLAACGTQDIYLNDTPSSYGMYRATQFDSLSEGYTIRVWRTSAPPLLIIAPQGLMTPLALEMHAHKVHAHEVHAHEVHAHEVYVPETHEMHAHEMHADEMHAGEVHTYPIRRQM